MMSNKGMSRRSFLGLCGIAGLGTIAGLAGCGGSGGGATTTAASTAAASGSSYDPVTLRVAFMPNIGSAGTLYAGIEQGYFDAVGITVEPQQFQAGPAEIAAMSSGDIDVAMIGHGAHSLAIQGQAKIFSFEQLSKADEVVANKAKGISSAADLKGKTVGVSSGTSSEVILQYVLEKAGLTKDDITTVEMDVSGMTTALISGQIDAAATWSPNTVTLKQQLGDNYLMLGTDTDFSDKVAFPGSYCCAPDYADKNTRPRSTAPSTLTTWPSSWPPSSSFPRRRCCSPRARATGRARSTPSATPTSSRATTRPSRRSSSTRARSRPRCPSPTTSSPT